MTGPGTLRPTVHSKIRISAICDLPFKKTLAFPRAPVATVGRSNRIYFSAISTRISPASNRLRASRNVAPSSCFMCALEALPQVIQIILGGAPSRKTNSTKSLSFVMMAAPSWRAALKISRSPASRNPNSRSAVASTENVSDSHLASEGGSCASSQSFMP
jgi:hypothetical protein